MVRITTKCAPNIYVLAVGRIADIGAVSTSGHPASRIVQPVQLWNISPPHPGLENHNSLAVTEYV